MLIAALGCAFALGCGRPGRGLTEVTTDARPPPARPAIPEVDAGLADAGAPVDGGPTAFESPEGRRDAGTQEAVVAADAGALPQTREKPATESAAFNARAHALFHAIAKDDPSLAMEAFFPVAAYEQVKAIPFPANDWRRRLLANFARDIHALHAELQGALAAGATFSRVEVPRSARWVEPGEEGNKLGYFRVYGTRLWVSTEKGERQVPISSLISWRGEWYVVHLTGFK